MPTTNGWLRPDLQQMWATPLVARVRPRAAEAVRLGLERRSMAVSRLFCTSMRAVACVRDDEAGQALVEYSLLLLLVAVAAIAAVSTFGLDVSKLYQSIVDVYP
jgi:Flp pilus assembly pilin Flp